MLKQNRLEIEETAEKLKDKNKTEEEALAITRDCQSKF